MSTVGSIPNSKISLTEIPYETIVDGLHELYQGDYAHYSKRLSEIEERTKEWQKQWSDMLADQTQTYGPRTKGALEKTLWEKVDIYINRKTIRTTGEKLKGLLDVYDKAIVECSPPGFLPPSTLKMLERLDLDVEAMKDRYNFIFETCLNQLKAERTTLQALYDRTEPVLNAMKEAAEPFASAHYKSGIIGYAISFAVSSYNFSYAVKVREAELNPTNHSEYKTNEQKA